MTLTTGGRMLNFGYWDGSKNPLDAQRALCTLVGELAGLSSARRVIDVGSGLGAPALLWKSAYGALDVVCVNVNFSQLREARRVSSVNATSTSLPFAASSADRVVALESAQHFKPLAWFVEEAARVLEKEGVLAIAMPVVARHSKWGALVRLGILSFTWSSEHYQLGQVRSAIERHFAIEEISTIGHSVYEPLAEYYIANREVLRKVILSEYPAYVEGILYRSMLKMKDASEKGVIDYVVLKARKA
jgi:ubiquinone/menaquinone biosynthesis C-methylase UbiE